MKKTALTTLAWLLALTATAQERKIEVESLKTTSHQTTIKGKRISYDAHTGTQPVWNEKGEPIASLFYTYYERNDVNDKDSRPLVFSFNGGPGSASIWMHMAYTGPYILKIDDEGNPVQPYGFKQNPHSILDVADIVFIDPVNTGYSRIVDPEAKRETFFGINADIKYLADWLNTFVSRQQRWPSPKYLIGESYGTTRVAGLAHQLQNAHWMFLNGVVLVSPTELGIDRGDLLKTWMYLPYFSATAWYHKQLPEDLQSKKLDHLLEEVEGFTLNEVVPAMLKGGFLALDDKKALAEKMSRYAGISAEAYLQHNLAVPTSFFWKELMRGQGLTVGRLDSRYRGLDRSDAGDRYDHDPALTSWNHAFAPAMNHYARSVLGFETDLTYNLFGPVHPWDRSGERTGEQLRQAMDQNPYMHVMVQSGYFDGGTDYFNAKFTLWQLDPSGKMRDRLRFEGYESGHMMYLRSEDLETSNEHIREFIRQSLPEKDAPAKY